MQSNDVHLSDQELLLAADGELPDRRAAQVCNHLSACWGCRARMAEIEETIVDFARIHRQSLDPQLPPSAGTRALLRTVLAELATKPRVASWRRFFQLASPTHIATCVCLALLVIVAGLALVFDNFGIHQSRSSAGKFETAVIPDRTLTPGATRPVAINDVCSMAHEDVVRAVPASLRREVLQEYRIANATADSYEIDYLIAPGLGGAEDIHNLWPETYLSATWNARVKDDLEERLHEMVCTGKLDLPTAQRDIATDWIAAYKKYFHTDRPLS